MGNQGDTSEDVSYEVAMQQLHELFLANMDETGLVEDPTDLCKSKGYTDHQYYYPMRSLAERQVRWIDGKLYVVFDLGGAQIEYEDSPVIDLSMGSVAPLAGLTMESVRLSLLNGANPSDLYAQGYRFPAAWVPAQWWN